MNFSLISAAPAAVLSCSSFPVISISNLSLFGLKKVIDFDCRLVVINFISKKKKKVAQRTSPLVSVCCGRGVRDDDVNCKAFLFDPVLKQALKEPVAFVGGMFAGIMRLDLNEDPLRDWLSRTTVQADHSKSTPQQQEEEEVPQQIEIE